jgi:8-oxo-dGTP pyrophosphatase MutT (NUDIX family)
LQFNIPEISSKYGGNEQEAAKRLMGSARFPKPALPLQVAAVCYRWRSSEPEFLLVNVNGGNKWTFPKGNPKPAISHSQTAEQEAWEEAGARGFIEPRHFHLYLHSKGVFWKPPGVREYVVKAFLMEVESLGEAPEPVRNPTWFSPGEARKMLAKGREVKYAHEIQATLDRAMEHLNLAKLAAAQ